MPWAQRSIGELAPDVRPIFRALVTGDADWPLYLWGDPGRGKTYAALCLTDVVKDAGFYTVEGLANSIMQPLDPSDLFGIVAGHELAVLDEIGLRTTGDLTYTAVTAFWESRERQGQRTVYVSNHSPADLPKLFDDRIASRLLCGTVFELQGDDRRAARGKK